MPLNHYSARGCIRKILISDAVRESDILKGLRYLIIDLNVYHDIQIIILAKSDEIKALKHDLYSPLLDVRVIEIKADTDLPTWLQDHVHVFYDGILIDYQVGQEPGILNTDLFQRSAQSVCSIAGGNLLFGNFNGWEYVLTGTLSDGQPTEISNLWNQISAASIIQLYTEQEIGTFDEVFFHADLTTTILGRTMDNSAELIMVAEAWTGELDKLNAILNQIVFKLNQFKIPDSDKYPFRIIRIPMFVLRGYDRVDGNDAVLSYNNCIVENYFIEEKHVVNVYLPDYTEQVDNYFEDIFKAHAYEVNKGTEKDSMSETDFFQKVLYPGLKLIMERLGIPGTIPTELPELKVLGYLVVLKTQQFIVNLLNKQGIYNVTFVRHNLTEISSIKSGSLHCLTKVIERSE
jgi:hypothetical protein